MLKIRKSAVLLVVVGLAAFNVEASPRRKAAPINQVQTSVSDVQANSSPLDGRLEIEPSLGFAFLSPKDVNTAIHDTNDSYQQQGVKSFNIPDIGSSFGFGGTVTYRVAPTFALGLGVNRLSSSSDGSAKVGNNSMNGTVGIGATLLTVETHITLTRSRNQAFEILFSPSAGIAFFQESSQFGGSALNMPTEVNTSSTGAVFGGTFGMRYWIVRNVAWNLNLGYRYAKSGDLRVDSQRNTNDSVGSIFERGGKKVNVDASAMVLATGLTWSL